MTILLIDADTLVYRAAYAAESVHEFAPGEWVSTASIEDAKDNFNYDVERIAEEAGADAIVLALTDKENFRKQLAPTYKAPRGKVRRPILLGPMREWLITEQPKDWKVRIKPGLEADDVVGILATGKLAPEAVICSTDKDLMQVAGRHLHPVTLEWSAVEPDEGHYQHMFQTLTGDSTDNYPGIPGVGPKKAAKILAEDRPMWDSVVAAFKAAGLTEEDALLQARLAKILQAEDYDAETGKPILWAPSKYCHPSEK